MKKQETTTETVITDNNTETISKPVFNDIDKERFEKRTLSVKVFQKSLKQYPEYFNDLLYKVGGYELTQKGKEGWEIRSNKNSVIRHMISIDQLLFFIRKVVNKVDIKTVVDQ